MLHNIRWRRRASFKAHLTSHPMSFIRRLTNLLIKDLSKHFKAFLYRAKHPIGGQRKHSSDNFSHIPPPLPLSVYCDDRRFACWCEHNGLHVGFVKIGGEKKVCNRI